MKIELEYGDVYNWLVHRAHKLFKSQREEILSLLITEKEDRDHLLQQMYEEYDYLNLDIPIPWWKDASTDVLLYDTVKEEED